VAEIKNFRELIVWKRAMELVVETYQLVKHLPKEETYALSDQIRRAAVAIPSNIAEGNGRGTPKDYARFLAMARGSKYELETQLMICVMLQYLTKEQIKKAMMLSDEIGRMLNVIIARLGE
jgi:four helix bundle protein